MPEELPPQDEPEVERVPDADQPDSTTRKAEPDEHEGLTGLRASVSQFRHSERRRAKPGNFGSLRFAAHSRASAGSRPLVFETVRGRALVDHELRRGRSGPRRGS